MKPERKEPDEGGCPLWVVTFGDAMSLLVTFFVMLVSFADFEEHSLQAMVGALKGGLRAVPLPMATAVAGADVDEDEDSDATEEGSAEPSSADGTNKAFSKHLPDTNVFQSSSSDYYLHLLKNGVSLVISRPSIFETGTAELSDLENEVWKVASDLMRSIGNEIRVVVMLPENVVVRLQGYKTPWGLGIEQAMAVQAYLASFSNGDIRRISTSVQVVKGMMKGEHRDGSVQIRYMGGDITEMQGMPQKILRGTWREVDTQEEGVQ